MDQIDRQVYLDYLARCEQAFRPFAPIDLPDFFQGRKDRIELLTSELATAGRQVAIYGERGVGKTSLAQLADFFASFSDEETYFVRCEKESTYTTIFGQFLGGAGVGYVPNGFDAETPGGGGIGIGPASVSSHKAKRSRFSAIESARIIHPAMLLKTFGDRKGLLIIDEYDRVEDEKTHTRLAETLKHFSDADSKTKIIVVGVAETLTGLIGEHESITRCLAQIKLDRMRPEELGDIIATGEERADVVFKDTVRQKIVALSDGFPFYTHLLCKYSADEAGKVLLKNDKAHVVVSESEYSKACRRAIESAEHTLREDYQTAVITTKRKTDMYKYILWGVAHSADKEVHVDEIAQNISYLTGTEHKKGSLNNYLVALVSPQKRQVLVRVRQGYYKFTNPLMRAYVRLILEEHNIVEENGQLQFPWMRKQ